VDFPEKGSPSEITPRTVFISDVHLGSEAQESARSVALRKFLSTLHGADVSDLYILGDLFDFWFEYRSVIFSSNFPVLRALARVRESGVRLHYIVGNHDYWAGTFLENVIGCTLYKQPTIAEIDTTRILLCHGDGLNRRDYGYRLFKAVARWKPAIVLFGSIHPDLAVRLGRMVSGLSRQLVNAETPGRLREARAVRAYAFRKLQNDNIDVVVAGHCHIPTDESIEINGRAKRYINLGDWLTHFTYAELVKGRITLKGFSGAERTDE